MQLNKSARNVADVLSQKNIQYTMYFIYTY